MISWMGYPLAAEILETSTRRLLQEGNLGRNCWSMAMRGQERKRKRIQTQLVRSQGDW